MNQEVRTDTGGTPPHNQRIEPTARGGHAFCEVSWVGASLRAKVAPVPSGPSASQAALRPCSRLIRALYGPCGGRTGVPRLVIGQEAILKRHEPRRWILSRSTGGVQRSPFQLSPPASSGHNESSVCYLSGAQLAEEAPPRTSVFA
jgi:hypothetical protein